MKKSSPIRKFFRTGLWTRFGKFLIDRIQGDEKVKSGNSRKGFSPVKPRNHENSAGAASNNMDQDIELLDIEPKKRINPEDRKNLQRVLEVINRHLPDRMPTTNPLRSEIDSRLRANQTNRSSKMLK